MKKLVKFINKDEVSSLIDDGSTIALTGFGGMGQCDEILKGIRQSFVEESKPKNLTIFHPAGQSDGKNGVEHLALEGLVKRIIGGHWGLAPNIQKLIEENKIEAFCLPQGQLIHLFNTIANDLPGHLSPVGLNTFVDPRIEGGKVNDITKNKEDIVELMAVDNKEYLFYKSVHLDYVLIRGTTVDEDGNLTTEEEPLNLEVLSAAIAAKACGGKVIAQAKYLSKRNTLHPKDIKVPAHLIDYVLLTEDVESNHRQTPKAVFNPSYNGDLKVPEANTLSPAPSNKTKNVRTFIGERAYRELEPNSVINIGIGIPGDEIGPIIYNHDNDAVVTVESGPIGGIPLGENQFGVSKNPEAILNQSNQFDYYHGVGVDIAFMGAGQVDRYGNVNVSKFFNRVIGCGGFIDITQTAKKVVFCSTFTAGGFDVEIDENEHVKINKEGKIKKFKENVDMITFSSQFSLERKIEVIYVTERGVFELTEQGIKLIEIAKGIDLQKDILDQMEFEPLICDTLLD